MRRRPLVSTLLALTPPGLMLLGLAWSPAWAKDAPPPPPLSERGIGEPGIEGSGREPTRARLQAQLERTRENEARLQRVIDAIDQGASPEEIRAMVREGGRERTRRQWSGDRPPRDPSGRGPMGRGNGEPLTEQQRQAVLAELETVAPEIAQRMRLLVERRPGAGDRMLQSLRGRLDELRRLRASDPEMAEIKVAEFRAGLEIGRATRAYRSTKRRLGDDAEEVVAARETLRAAIASGVEAKLRFHEAEVVRLERRVARARQDLAAKRARQGELIEEQLERATEPRGSESGPR